MKTKSLEQLSWGLGALVALSTALMVTSCNSEAIVDPVKNADLHIQASIGNSFATTKSPETNLHENTFVSGDQIQVYMWNTTNSANATQLVNRTLNYDGATWTPSSIPDIIPATCTKGEVLGVYPYNQLTVTTENRNSDFTFEISESQSSSSDYNQNDLMAAYNGNVNYKTPTAALQFKHILSKLIFNFEYENGATNGAIDAEIAFICMEAQISNLLSNNPTVTALVGGNNYSITSNVVEILSNSMSSNAAVILPPQKIGSSDYTTFSCPGTTLTVKINDVVFSGRFANMELKSGYAYTFTVKIKDVDKTLAISEPTIIPWETDATNPGGTIIVE